MPLDVGSAFDIQRAITHGWEGLKRQPLGVLLGSFLLTITEGGSGGSSPPTGGGGSGDDWQMDQDGSFLPNLLQAGPLDDQLRALGVDLGTTAGMALIAVGLVCVSVIVVAVWLFRSWIHAGYIGLHRELVVTGQAEAGTLFTGGPRFWDMAVWKLLKAFVGIGVFGAAMVPAILAGVVAHFALHKEDSTVILVAVIPALLIALPALVYVSLGLTLGEHAVVIDGLRPVGALERSWSLAKGNRVNLFAYFLVTSLFGVLGVCLCCIGIVLTRGIVDVGTTEAYLLATREADDLALVKELGL